MPKTVDELALETSKGVQELNEGLARASQIAAPLTELQWDLLSTVVAGALTIALIALAPEEAVGIGVLTALAGASAALGISTSILAGTVLALDLLGNNQVGENDRKVTKFVCRFTGNAFTVTLGAVGLAIDGDYGFETGVSVGEIGGILMDTNDTIKAVTKAESAVGIALYEIQLIKELKEFSLTPQGEHVLSGQHIWADHLNAESMTKDMIEHPARVSKPAVIRVTDRPPARPSTDNRAAQTKLDRSIFDSPGDPIYSPVYPAPVPAPVAAPVPARVPAPAPAPVPAPAPAPAKSPEAPWNTPLLPEYLGGGEPAQPSDHPLCSDAALPDVTDDAPDIKRLP